IESESERQQLRARLQKLMPEDEKGGFIVRTSAEDASEADLQADIDYLRRRWREILEGSRRGSAPVLLYQELSLAQRVLRDIASVATVPSLVDSADALADLIEFAKIYMPPMVQRLRQYTGERPLFELHAIENEIARALSRRVDLKSGGYLIIDQTEALT